MAWSQDSNYYSNYGNYGDYGAGGVDSASYDMFEVDNQQPQESAQPQYTQDTSSSFFDPNTYQQHQPDQYRSSSRSSQPYQRGPTPTNAYGGAHQPAMKPQPATSGYSAAFGGPPIVDNLMNNPMVTGMAMQYGQDIVGRGGEEIKKNLDKYVSIGQLKYYFAVDTNYVARKLGLLLFPFTKSDWSIKYNQDEPVQPKYDVNAPDLYIPTMAYATYVLLVGYILGLRNAFSPDFLATTASSSLVWLILEIGLIYLTLTVMSINTSLTKWDILSFSSYKYVSIIAVLLCGLLLGSKGFYLALIYSSSAFMFFLLRTLKLGIGPEVHGMQVHGKRKLYIILLYAILQPLLIWWMTYSLVPISSSVQIPQPAPNAEDLMPFQQP